MHRALAVSFVALAIAIAVAVAGCGRVSFGETARDGAAGDATIADATTTGAFTELTLPPGGAATGIDRAADGTLYVVLSGNRVMRSSSNAAVWTPCALDNNDYINQLYVDRATGAIYLAGIPAVLISTDGCASWSDTGLGQSGTTVGVIGARLFAGTYDGGLWVETDGTWAAVSTPMDGATINDITVDAAHGRVFLAGDNGLARSVNSGGTWTSQNNGLPGDGVLLAVLDPSNQTRAIVTADADLQASYQTSNDGGSWSAAIDGGFAIAFDPADPSFVLFADYNSGLTASTDNGATFPATHLRTPAMQDSSVNGLVFDASSGVYAATGRGVFYAADHTLGWQELDTGIAGWDVTSILPAADGSLYLGTAAGVLRSTDGGSTWSEGSTGLFEDSAITNVLDVPGAPGSIVVGSENGVVRSDDHGQTFTTVYAATMIDTYQIGSATIAAGLLVFGTGGGVVISDPTWTTFTYHQLGGSQRFVNGVIALDATATKLVAATADGVYYSNDSGASFNDISAGLPAQELTAPTQLADGSLLVATQFDGLYRTTAPGASWTPSGLQGQSVYNVLVTSGGIIAAAQGGVFASTDGASWQPVPGLEQRSPFSLAIDANGQLLVGTIAAGLYRTPQP